LPFKEVQVRYQTSSRFLIANKALAGTSLPSTAQTAAAFCVELPTRVGQRDGSAGKNEGCTVRTKKCSGQLILTPVIRAYAVDSSTLRFGQAGRCDTVYDSCGRPFFRRILSSLHREPERRKRNAHGSAFRQSLHCLIAEHFENMHLRCRFTRFSRSNILLKAKGLFGNTFRIPSLYFSNCGFSHPGVGSHARESDSVGPRLKSERASPGQPIETPATGIR